MSIAFNVRHRGAEGGKGSLILEKCQVFLYRYMDMNPYLKIASQHGGLWTPPNDTAFPIDIEAITRFLRRLQLSNYIVERPPIHFGLLADLRAGLKKKLSDFSEL